MRALDELVRDGKVRAIGCSNFSRSQVSAALDTAARIGTAAFVTCQDEYSLLVRKIERDLVPLMRERNMTLLPYAPLAGGFLSGKYQRNRPLPKNARLAYSSHHASDVINERNWDIADRLRDFASRTNRSLLDIAFGWLLARPVTASVIAGAMTPEQIEQNVRAGSVKLPGGRSGRTRPDHAVGIRGHGQAASFDHRRFGRRPVRREHAAQHRLGHDRVRAQRRGAFRPRRRHQHASAIARRHQTARHPVRQLDGDRDRQGGVPRSRRPLLRRAADRAADELLGPGVPLAPRSDPGRQLSARQVARAGRAGRRAASRRFSPTARGSAAIC